MHLSSELSSVLQLWLVWGGINRRDCRGLHYLYGSVMGNEQVAELLAVYAEDFSRETPITAAEHGSHGLLGVSGNEGVVILPQPQI